MGSGHPASMLWSVYLDRESEAVNPDKESDERYDDVGVSRPSFHSPTGAPSAEDCYHFPSWLSLGQKTNHWSLGLERTGLETANKILGIE